MDEAVSPRSTALVGYCPTLRLRLLGSWTGIAGVVESPYACRTHLLCSSQGRTSLA
jgi:hypothetical protein